MSTAYRSWFKPTSQQEMLLRAALMEGPDAIKSWEAWRNCSDLNSIDFSSARLLPLLSSNLRAQGINDPLIDKFAQIHRSIWGKNQLLFYRIADLIKELYRNSVQTMLLKGTAVSTVYYADLGLREMCDADLLVPTAQAAQALQIVLAQGWRSNLYGLDIPACFFNAQNGINMRNPELYELDLHWHVLHECCEIDADDDFWREAISVDFHGVPTLALNPADQLLHTCVHGVNWMMSPELRWIADAMMILKRTPQLNWERLITQVQKRQLTLQMRETLTYLRDLLDAPIPDNVLGLLNEQPITRSERFIFKRKTTPLRRQGLLTFLRTYAQLYARTTSQVSWWRGPAEFTEFLRFTWGEDALKELPFQAVVKIIRRAQISLGTRESSHTSSSTDS